MNSSSLLVCKQKAMAEGHKITTTNNLHFGGMGFPPTLLVDLENIHLLLHEQCLPN